MNSIFKLFFVFTSLIFLLSVNAYSMEFEVTQWRNHSVIRASGEIIKGDSLKFKQVIKVQKPLPHGYAVILLDSPGGSVIEALNLSQIIDKYPIHMVIPHDGSCASACASILFVAGSLRTVEEGGKFGQHTCSISGIRNKKCNEMISKHALEHGVSYGSIHAFLKYVDPDDINWFSRTAVDCHGISRYAFESASGFEKNPEPCFMHALTGKWPQAQSAWRVDFYKDGYKAFLRPGADHDRRLQLNLFCNELKPGNLYLSIDVQGDANSVRAAIIRGDLYAKPIIYKNVRYYVEQEDPEFTNVIIKIPQNDVLKFLTKSNELIFNLKLKPPYERIMARTFLSKSRKAVIFAANNCINKSKT